MQICRHIEIDLPHPAATDRLAVVMADFIHAGDTILLSGHVGAGKSHFARAFIRSHFGPSEDVPSPSFTLVQAYQNTTVEIWHADLYRLSHPDEVQELGLIDAMQQAICLIEWPDRLGDLITNRAIHLSLSAKGDVHRATLVAPHHPDMIATILREFADDCQT